MKNQITKYAFLHALFATIYITLVATIMFNIERLIGPTEGDGDNIFAPIGFLTLFVLSAAVMAVTIFGRPLMWYLDGKKTEAVRLTLYTIGFLAVFAAIIFFCLTLQY
jgi:hypothetical protein